MNNFKIKTLAAVLALASFGAQSAILPNPDSATKIGSKGTFVTEDRCLFTNVTPAVMAYDGKGTWIVTKVGTIDIEAKGQKVIAVTPVGTLVDSKTGTTVASQIKYNYKQAKNATVDNADNIVGVASKTTDDFSISVIDIGGIVWSTETEAKSGVFNTTDEFNTKFELGGYAEVDATKVKEGVEYLIQHDVECIQ